MSLPTKKQSRLLWFALTALAIASTVLIGVAAVWGLGRVLNLLSPVVWPLAIAAVIACVLSPLVDFFERKKIARARSILLVFVIAFTLILGALASVIPQIVVETEQLVSKIPEYSKGLQTQVNEFIAHPPEFLRHFLPQVQSAANPNSADNQEKSMISSATTWLTDSLPKVSSWLLSRVVKVISGFGLLAGLFLIPVYVFYFLLEKHGIKNHWKEYLPLKNSRAKDEAVFVLNAIGQYLVAFFRGQVLVAICSAVLYTIGFLVIGLNYSFLIGFAAVFLAMIPFLGAMVICATALILAFVQYGDWQHPTLVLAVFGVVQSPESFLISPKIMGDRVGLHPLVIIIAVMVGTTLLGGILGGILAIPLAAALRVIMFRYVWKQREA